MNKQKKTVTRLFGKHAYFTLVLVIIGLVALSCLTFPNAIFAQDTPTPSSIVSPSPTPTETPSPSDSPSPTSEPSDSPSPTPDPTPTPTPSPSPSPTPIQSASPVVLGSSDQGQNTADINNQSDIFSSPADTPSPSPSAAPLTSSNSQPFIKIGLIFGVLLILLTSAGLSFIYPDQAKRFLKKLNLRRKKDNQNLRPLS